MVTAAQNVLQRNGSHLDEVLVMIKDMGHPFQ